MLKKIDPKMILLTIKIIINIITVGYLFKNSSPPKMILCHIYSPSCCSKAVQLTFFHKTQNEIFRRMSKLVFPCKDSKKEGHHSVYILVDVNILN